MKKDRLRNIIATGLVITGVMQVTPAFALAGSAGQTPSHGIYVEKDGNVAADFMIQFGPNYNTEDGKWYYFGRFFIE